MAEGGVGFVDHFAELGRRDLAVGEGLEDGERDLLIGFAAQAADFLLGKLRPFFGEIKTAIARKTGKQRVAEAERSGFAARRDILHHDCPSSHLPIATTLESGAAVCPSYCVSP
ncbi:hypothetical protein D9M72_507570 [compost metagenome]